MFRIYNSFADCRHCSVSGNPASILDTNTDSLNEAEIVFVGENPGRVEIHRMIPFTGQSGVYLRRVLRHILENYKWIITNTVYCSTIDKEYTINPSKRVISKCNTNAMKLIEIADPILVVLLGRSAVMGLLQEDMINKSMAGMVGHLYHLRGVCSNRLAYVEYHPRYVKDSSDKESLRYCNSFVSVETFLRGKRKNRKYDKMITKDDFISNFRLGAYYEQTKIVDPV